MSNRFLQSVLVLLLLSPIGAQAQNLPYLTDDTFHATVNNGGPMVVFFRAPWCGPCNSMNGSLETLAARYQGRVQFMQVDVQAHPNIGHGLGIRNLPDLRFYKEGAMYGHLIGEYSIDRIEGEIQTILR